MITATVAKSIPSLGKAIVCRTHIICLGAPLCKAGHSSSLWKVSLLKTFMKEVMSQQGKQGNNTSGSCLAIVWRGWTVCRYLYGLCVRDPSSSGGSTPSCYAGWRACCLVSRSPSHPWSSLRHPPLHIAELSGQQAGQGRAGGLPLVWTKHVPVLGSHQHVEEVPGSLSQLRKHLELFRGKEQTTAHTPTLGAQALGMQCISTYE